MTVLKIALTAAALGVLPLANVQADESLRPMGPIVATRALDGDTLVLADGRMLRLAGVVAPKINDRDSSSDIQAIAAAAAAELARLAVAGADIVAFADALAEDRHGRMLLHLRSANGAWLQDQLLERGFARVLTLPGAAARAQAMLTAEAAARAARRGLWALPVYAIRQDREAGRHTDSFQLVEGRVLRFAATRETLYLNFGRDWRRDFTIGIDRPAWPVFRRGGLEPHSLAGRRVRVRGWILWRNGPYLAATHPEQIEVLD